MKSKWFTREEFACKCGCGQDTVDAELLRLLERIREHFGAPVLIGSGNRCVEYNRDVGGSERSQHLLSKAADIEVVGVSPRRVARYATELGAPGVGDYESFTHIDVRSGPPARWSSF